jgi:tRNA1(Val) A37 N6-methylase TrmN6
MKASAASIQFNKLSIDLTHKLTKTVKKAQGIYFTPKSITGRVINKTISHLTKSDSEGNIRILEPSCGSCEFVKALDDVFSDVSITCVEQNAEIFSEITKLTFKNQVDMINADFISLPDTDKYDLIIGNPPYFVCKRDVVPAKYDEYITGRPNIFGLFIIHSLHLLKPNGILAFVIPKSFLNSVYYSSIRNLIKKTCDIIEIEDYADANDFLDTEQSTFGLFLKKRMEVNESSNCCPYSIQLNGNYIFTPNAAQLNAYFENATTIQKLGLAVKTGSIVWNEKKDLLTDDELNTILLYNTNITNDNKVKLTTFKNDEKGQYIQVEGSTDPVIVVNRGNGNASYNFKYALIEKLMPFVVENHLNVIYSSVSRKKSELSALYKKIICSFENPKTKEFIELFFGNNGLSKTELETILPIF